MQELLKYLKEEKERLEASRKIMCEDRGKVGKRTNSYMQLSECIAYFDGQLHMIKSIFSWSESE